MTVLHIVHVFNATKTPTERRLVAATGKIKFVEQVSWSGAKQLTRSN
jgi:hypothetical protein